MYQYRSRTTKIVEEARLREKGMYNLKKLE